MRSCLNCSGVIELSKQDYCIHFAEVSHLSIQERLDAASWCLNRFDHTTVDLFRTKEAIGRYRNGRYRNGRYSTETVYGFYFAREKDVTMFKLAWG